MFLLFFATWILISESAYFCGSGSKIQDADPGCQNHLNLKYGSRMFLKVGLDWIGIGIGIGSGIGSGSGSCSGSGSGIGIVS